MGSIPEGKPACNGLCVLVSSMEQVNTAATNLAIMVQESKIPILYGQFDGLVKDNFDFVIFTLWVE